MANLDLEIKQQVERMQQVDVQMRQELDKAGLGELQNILSHLDMKIQSCEREIARLAAEAEAKWKSSQEAKNVQQDRNPMELYGDIMQAPDCVLRALACSTSQVIQHLESTQRRIEQGLLPADHDYASVKDYFCYSQTRKCAIHLHKVSSNPATWQYKAYYMPQPLQDVQDIFAKIQTETISALPTDVPIDKLAYADA